MFRRRKAEVEPVEDEATEEERTGPRADGPWDVSELDIPEDDESRLDLGSLLLTPPETLDVQLQVDEASGQVAAVIMAGEEGAVELRAFAAPRNGDIWDDVRRQVAGEVARLGGTATEVDGPWGSELRVALTVELPDGQHAPQTSRVIGIPGPRWLLRATMFGRPAVEYNPDGDVERALRDVVVVRGGTPIPPGDPLPLTIPPTAQRLPSQQ
ncbi:MAG TPA: DUF3710 domain-containing protein [Nocardioidaceae bacterium]|nr:DUF3710 domain-containing protein [Nocardioidaceae bacterium]